MSAIRAVPPADPAPPVARLPASRALAQLKIPGKTWGETWGKTWGTNFSDREFLAPALEILETPPSPVHVAFLWIICAFAFAALAWAYFGRVDIIAAAQGKFQPMGQVKVVEPVETGRVEDIRVGNGALVRAGDVLVEFDRSVALADTKGARAELASARAEILRRRTALASARSHRFDAVPAIDWPDDAAPALRERENQVLTADLGQLAANVASFDAERSHKSAERDKLRETIATQKNLVATLQERVNMRTKLVEEKAGAKAAVIDATETLQYQITQEAKQEQDLASLTAGLAVIARNSDKAVQDFISDDAEKLSDAERRAEDAEQRLAKAEAGLDHLTLKAPIAGRVQSSIITNVGQVVESGQEIMRIVPEDSGLEIQAYVRNRDIGFVSVGQEAVVKVESFPFTRYGAIKARVTRIAKDAIPEPDANAIEGDPTRVSNAAGFAGGERTQNLVFPVVLKPDAETITVDGVAEPLTSGMAVTVELKTGARRMLEYLFAPLVEVASKAMRER
jgi:hemolysin D